MSPETIRFEAVVGQDQVIRPPAGVTLPQGPIEVLVKPATGGHGNQHPLEQTRAWLLALAAEAEQAAPNLPGDMAEHHDHYAHGKPLP